MVMKVTIFKTASSVNFPVRLRFSEKIKNKASKIKKINFLTTHFIYLLSDLYYFDAV